MKDSDLGSQTETNNDWNSKFPTFYFLTHNNSEANNKEHLWIVIKNLIHNGNETLKL
jgi:hypothetical protein